MLLFLYRPPFPSSTKVDKTKREFFILHFEQCIMRCPLSYIISKRKVTNIYFHFIMLSKLSAVKNIPCVLVSLARYEDPLVKIYLDGHKNICGMMSLQMQILLLLTRIHGHDEMHDIRSAFCLLKWSGFCSSWNFGSTYVKHLIILAFYNWKLEQRRKLNHIWFIYPNFLQPFHWYSCICYLEEEQKPD